MNGSRSGVKDFVRGENGPVGITPYLAVAPNPTKLTVRLTPDSKGKLYEFLVPVV